MRYFLTLPFAALALAASPAIAQDTATPPEGAPTQTPPAEPDAMDPATPPADPTDPAPSASDAPPVATPAEPVQPPEAATPATPAAPATPPANAATPATGLTAEQKAAYDAWPAETKAYFDALPPGRQMLFLRIADADKAKLVALPASQQEAVWTSLEKQNAEQKTKQPGGR